ncbi:MAG: hypothetical protein ABGY71_07890 [bacterium]|nr:hypothetical protein [Planctomycetota bacterium]HIL52877.1 hypothetical protein [Planctomycetota bacterium]
MKGAEEKPEPAYDPERARTQKSTGAMSDQHWSRTRRDMNAEEIEFLRERSRAPGVAEGGEERNHYCLDCHGLIPLTYDRRQPADPNQPAHCPHCGTELEANVRMMFNWVEIDQPHGSDFLAILPRMVGALLLLGAAAALVYYAL